MNIRQYNIKSLFPSRTIKLCKFKKPINYKVSNISNLSVSLIVYNPIPRANYINFSPNLPYNLIKLYFFINYITKKS